MRVARDRTSAGSGTSHSSLESDCGRLRKLYKDERHYSRARNEGRPGREVLVKFFCNSIPENDIRGLLGAIAVAAKLREPPSEMMRSADSLSALRRDVRLVKRRLKERDLMEMIRNRSKGLAQQIDKRRYER